VKIASISQTLMGSSDNTWWRELQKIILCIPTDNPIIKQIQIDSYFPNHSLSFRLPSPNLGEGLGVRGIGKSRSDCYICIFVVRSIEDCCTHGNVSDRKCLEISICLKVADVGGSEGTNSVAEGIFTDDETFYISQAREGFNIGNFVII
jgi:hypothetical protein